MVNWAIVDEEWDKHGRMSGDRAVWYLLGEYEPLEGTVDYKKKREEKSREFDSLKKALLKTGGITETKEKEKVPFWADGSGDDKNPFLTLLLGYKKIAVFTAHRDKIIAFYEENVNLPRPPFLFEDARQSLESAPPNLWPWGGYETELLRILAATVNEFWANPDDAEPTNDFIVNWILTSYEGNRRVSKNIADAIATIIRPDGLKTGPRSR
jgi:hypothetical protein